MSKKSSAQRRLERVREAFDPEALKRICVQTDFSQYAPKIDLPDTYHWRGGHATTDRFFYYRDTGAPVLAVAHLDHVQEDGTATIVDSKAGPLVLSGALDDRLGAYVILELLPKLGIQVDWLLTTNEEMGDSTAKDFTVDHKKYNWMIEFDRGGTDVVMYQYENRENRELVRASGADVGTGSYSDIADLEHLGCAGFNWGVGYYDYHSRRAHAWLEDTFRMVSKFMRFYAANASTHLPHVVEEWPWAEESTETCTDCKSELDMMGRCWNCGNGVGVVALGEALAENAAKNAAQVAEGGQQ